MTNRVWEKLIPHLPKNLTVDQVCNVFRRERSLIYRRLKAAGYKPKAQHVWKIPRWAAEADWSLTNAEIARWAVAQGLCETLSRERVRQFRHYLGKKLSQGKGRVEKISAKSC